MDINGELNHCVAKKRIELIYNGRMQEQSLAWFPGTTTEALVDGIRFICELPRNTRVSLVDEDGDCIAISDNLPDNGRFTVQVSKISDDAEDSYQASSPYWPYVVPANVTIPNTCPIPTDRKISVDVYGSYSPSPLQMANDFNAHAMKFEPLEQLSPTFLDDCASYPSTGCSVTQKTPFEASVVTEERPRKKQKTSSPAKGRQLFTAEQISSLSDFFAADPRPSAEVTRQIAEKLHLSTQQVRIWFQNRRSRMLNSKNAHNKNRHGGSGSDTSSSNY